MAAHGPFGGCVDRLLTCPVESRPAAVRGPVIPELGGVGRRGCATRVLLT